MDQSAGHRAGLATVQRALASVLGNEARTSSSQSWYAPKSTLEKVRETVSAVKRKRAWVLDTRPIDACPTPCRIVICKRQMTHRSLPYWLLWDGARGAGMVSAELAAPRRRAPFGVLVRPFLLPMSGLKAHRHLPLISIMRSPHSAPLANTEGTHRNGHDGPAHAHRWNGLVVLQLICI